MSLFRLPPVDAMLVYVALENRIWPGMKCHAGSIADDGDDQHAANGAI